jgi:hypothetical protein
MAKAVIKTGRKKVRRSAPAFNGIVVRRPHVAPDTPLPKLRQAVKTAVRRYYDGLATAE